MRDGRPVLIIEAYGKRLTGLASASAAEIHAALRSRGASSPAARQVLKVETYNGEPAWPARSPTAWPIGFVRDYPGMTYYAAWAKQDRQTAAIAVPHGGSPADR